MLKLLIKAPRVTFADLELGLTPVVRRASQLVQENKIGRVQTAAIRLQSSWGSVPDYDLCNFNHLCTWYVDVLNRILNTSPKRMLLLDGSGTSGRRQNHSIAHLDYDGIWGTLQANITSVGELEAGIEINGNDGDLIADILNGVIRYRTRLNPEWTVEQHPALQPHAGWPGMYESIAAFLNALGTGESSVNGALTMVKLQLIGLAAEKSKDSGTWADVQDIDSII